MKPLQLGICGLGTVASAAVNVLQRNATEISARAGRDVIVVHVGARRDNPLCDTSQLKVSRDIFEVVNDPSVDVVVELIGGIDVAKDLVLKAIANGKHVVTANKALIAEHGNDIFKAAQEQGVTVAYEAAVAGGIPVIKALRDGLSANRIDWLAGIINGTGNFILTEMRDKGRAFEDVLKEAQALGYAEADPTFDVEGIDAAHKLVILASIAFGMPLRFDRVYTQGISKIAQKDVGYAEEFGYRIKHLGIARKRDEGVELRVHPTLIPESKLLANVNGVMNAVMIQADAVGPTLYYGAGAGGEATASAVIADIIDIARQIDVAPLGIAQKALEATDVLDSSAFRCAHYLRLHVVDKPGVLSKVASLLSDAGISIEAMIQKAEVEEGAGVPLVLLTNIAVEQQVTDAVAAIEQLDFVLDKVTHIRVEALEG